jgi:protein-S-isoprenylcysteine O-methyltransferase Ste14
MYDFIIAFLVCLATYMLHTESHYSAQRGRRPRFPESLIDAAVTIGYLAWFYMIFSDPLRAGPPLYITLLGLAIGVSGILMVVAGAREKRGFGETGRLVTTGIYSRIGNPIYLGMVLAYAGFPLAAGSLLTLASLIAWAPFMLLWRAWEARELEKRFGREYIEYKKRTFF